MLFYFGSLILLIIIIALIFGSLIFNDFWIALIFLTCIEKAY
jgi:hypothetical protein